MGELVDCLERSYEAYRRRLRESFWEICARTVEEAALPAREDELRAHLVFNAGVLVRTHGSLVAIDLGVPTGALGTPELREVDRIALALYSHNHSDHIGREFLRLMPRARVYSPREAQPRILDGCVEPGLCRVISAGEEFEEPGVRVRAFAADHMHKEIGENLAYAVEQDGFRWCHLGDARDFSTDIPPGLDLLFASVYLEVKDERFNWGTERAREMARMCAESGARCVVLVHLMEVGHEHAKAWRFLHAGLVKEMILSVRPRAIVRAPAPGEVVRLRR